ncbi:MAG TPA: TonB-dependent receptor [Opitutales bacterium]|nr:TonB-dependent receptor [Opitutales bacterium]
MQNELLTTNRKALTINLDPLRYGTFAEIGAGQETARSFFQAGASAGTVAKSISAYDMKFSDEIYGKCGRYVSEGRLGRMLQYEYNLLNKRLAEIRGKESTFFAFANTVAAKSYRGTGDSHGWLGIRFQHETGSEPNDIVLHVRMLDKENVQQQQALGIIGVNLVYGAFYFHSKPVKLIRSLLDNVGRKRIEVDLIRFSGPAFSDVDNRLMSLQLIQQNLTRAVMFSPDGDVLQPSEVLYKKAIFVERGSFRPVTLVNVDMLKTGLAHFAEEPGVEGEKIVRLAEITIRNLLSHGGEVDDADFLARVDLLGTLGLHVLVSDYPEYYRLASYFRRYTKAMIGIVMGANNLVEIFDERYYEDLDGGILESFGRLFRNTVRLYVYPMRRRALEQSLALDEAMGEKPNPAPHQLGADEFVTADNLQVFPNLRHLYQHLISNEFIVPIHTHREDLPNIFSSAILKSIREDDGIWEKSVPPEVVQMIKKRGLFGYDSKIKTSSKN